MLNKQTKLMLIGVFLLGIFLPETQAQDQQLATKLNKVVSAYGGDQLKMTRYLSFDYEWRLAWTGQGFESDYVNYVNDKFYQKYDLKNKRSSVERWISQNGNYYHDRIVTGTGESFSLNYFSNEYSLDSHQSFAAQYRLQTLYSDLLLAYEMSQSPQKFSYAGEGNYLGRPAEVFLYQFREKSKPMKVKVDPEQGYILYTERESASGTITRGVFEQHKKMDGLLYASENRFFRNSQLIYYTLAHSISTQVLADTLFTIDEGFSKQGELIESSKLAANEVLKGIYHVGSSGSFSTFFKDNNDIIGVNTYGGLKEKFAELQKVTKLPVKYMIVTHHHGDHLDGIQDAMEQGVTLVVTEMTHNLLKKSAQYNIDGVEVIVVKNTLNLGPLKLFVVSSTHAAQNLVVYHQKQKLLYQDDHYNAVTPDNYTQVNQSGLILAQQLAKLNLDIQWILGGHGPKAEPWKEFTNAVDATFVNNICPSKRPICANENY